ncbi:MAG: GTPase HflX [Candidatus Latescibacterota bacterium]|nr:MAG: GTPase HflX [Candidatus Latescibacterota bacterium]
MKKGFQLAPQEKLVERAYLVGVSLPDGSVAKETEHLEELQQLATTAGAIVVGKTVQARTRIDGATFIGPGKAEELHVECKRLDANLVVFDSDLSPAQARNLEKILKINVIDRTELILDIFARHAKTQQAKTQVELAQLIYTLPRLRKLWDHLSRQQGGIGTRGPGETQLEVDRRRVYERIGRLKRQLKKFDRRKDTLRQSRVPLPVVAVVGYTNAGKSTLMNAMTDADTLVENRLFATLDTLTRKIETSNHVPILLVDTVGFIRKLPHHLVESFKATLGDIAEADLWLHVIDASHPGYAEQMSVADQTLYSIRRSNVDTLYVFNKIDQLDADTLAGFKRRYDHAVFISAKNATGLEELDNRVHELLLGKDVQVEVRIPSTDGKGIARVNSLLRQPASALVDGHCLITGVIESRLVMQLEDVSGAEVRYLS